MFPRGLRFFLALSMTVPAFAAVAQTNAPQTASTTQSSPTRQSCTCAAQALKPYTAEFKITQVQTLANGVTLTHESSEVMARDSAGRQMRSTTQQDPQSGGEQYTYTWVFDRVEGRNANWYSRTRKATIIQYPPKDQQHGCWSDAQGFVHAQYGRNVSAPQPTLQERALQPSVASEKLGKSTIQGIEVLGARITQTIPAGKIGNDQPLVTTQETWEAPSFGLTLRSVQDDPRTGTTTRELVNLTQGEPDPALFQPPDGYDIKTVELHPVPCQQ